MTNRVPVPLSKTDPFLEENSDTAPVHLRLTRLDGTSHRYAADARVLAKTQPIIRIDGVLYAARGSEGAERLYREVTTLVLDDLPSGAEDDAFRAGRKLGIEQAAAIVDREQTRFESAKYVLEQVAANVRKFGASQ